MYYIDSVHEEQSQKAEERKPIPPTPTVSSTVTPKLNGNHSHPPIPAGPVMLVKQAMGELGGKGTGQQITVIYLIVGKTHYLDRIGSRLKVRTLVLTKQS